MSALSVDVIDNYYYNRDPAISGFWKEEYITYYKERNASKLNHLPLSVRVPIEEDNPSILRHEAACIRCGMCKEACTNLMGGVHGSYTLEETGNRAICIYCGQCANVCPVDSIVERDECPQVRQAAADLTIVEEASELIRRITEKDRPCPSSPAAAPAGYTLPRCMPPSCCPIYPPQRAPSVCRGPR